MTEFIRVRRSQGRMALGVPYTLQKVLECVEFVSAEQVGDGLLFTPLVVAEPQQAPESRQEQRSC